MNNLTIGQAARLAGVGVETIRFYERQGLIEQPPKPRDGFRVYPAETVRRIRFIRRAKQIGFTLKEIRELLGFYFDPVTSCAEVRQRAAEKIADMDARIAALQRMKAALQALADECGNDDNSCPILASLTEDWE
ncbi:MAG: MerR family DNA-binding protein [Geothermobacteraceae bacterium]